MTAVWPTFRCNDAPKVIAFLKEAFGFEEAAVYTDDGGLVAHAELRWPGGGGVMLGSAEGRDDVFAQLGRASIYVACDNPDELHDRAVAAGAEIVMPLKDEDYGSRGFSALDPAGNVWSFGTYKGA